jgi:hypothetical protein
MVLRRVILLNELNVKPLPHLQAILILHIPPSGKTHQSLSEQVQGLILVPVSPVCSAPLVPGLLDQRGGFHRILPANGADLLFFSMMGL